MQLKRCNTRDICHNSTFRFRILQSNRISVKRMLSRTCKLLIEEDKTRIVIHIIADNKKGYCHHNVSSSPDYRLYHSNITSLLLFQTIFDPNTNIYQALMHFVLNTVIISRSLTSASLNQIYVKRSVDDIVEILPHV